MNARQRERRHQRRQQHSRRRQATRTLNIARMITPSLPPSVHPEVRLMIDAFASNIAEIPMSQLLTHDSILLYHLHAAAWITTICPDPLKVARSAPLRSITQPLPEEVEGMQMEEEADRLRFALEYRERVHITIVIRYFRGIIDRLINPTEQRLISAGLTSEQAELYQALAHEFHGDAQELIEVVTHL